MASALTRRQWLQRATLILGASAMPGGGSLASNRPTISPLIRKPNHLIRAGTNENPYGASRAALQAIYKTMHKVGHYDGQLRRDLHNIISNLNGIPREQISIGSGSGEILRVAALIANQARGSVVAADPTYQDILRYSTRMGSKIIRVPVRDDLGVDLAAMKRAIAKDTRLVYIVNPNNPIPSILNKAELEEFILEVSEKCMVFVDEAYFEFVEDPAYGSMLGLVKAGHKNILVSRTASKIHGMAGLRIGFGFGHPDLIRDIDGKKTGQLNVLGLAAAVASYQDHEFQDFTRRKIGESKLIVNNMLNELTLRTVKSHTNFVFFKTGRDVVELNRALLARGIKVGRPFQPYTNWSRVSLQKPEEMKYFVQVYKELFG